ncbi:MAG: carboxymuconolactone decarboxylase family protein, partial [Dehalococcoidia bacterium]
RLAMDISEASKERGRQVRVALNGSPVARNAATSPAFDLVPDMEDYLLGAIFGEVWSRPQLELKTRSVITMAILAAQGQEPQLKVHIGYALNLGWTEEEISEMFLHVMPYAGAPAALNALRVASDVFKARAGK